MAAPRPTALAPGSRAAAAILALRQNDGSSRADPNFGVDYFPNNEPGYWRQDPISLSTLALGAYWGEVRPFVMRSSSQFRLPKRPELESDAYTEAFNETKDPGRRRHHDPDHPHRGQIVHRRLLGLRRDPQSVRPAAAV